MWCEDDELTHIEDTLRSESLDFSDEEIKKTCTKCGKEKRLDEFGPNRKGKYGKQARCNECEVERKKAYRKEHPEGKSAKNRRYKRWKERRDERRRDDKDFDALCRQADRLKEKKVKFGIAPEVYLAKLDASGGLCEICGLPETASNQWGPLPLATDHDHTTGAVRGMLCMKCNLKLFVLEDKAFVAAAQVYLDKYSQLAHSQRAQIILL